MTYEEAHELADYLVSRSTEVGLTDSWDTAAKMDKAAAMLRAQASELRKLRRLVSECALRIVTLSRRCNRDDEVRLRVLNWMCQQDIMPSVYRDATV